MRPSHSPTPHDVVRAYAAFTPVTPDLAARDETDNAASVMFASFLSSRFLKALEAVRNGVSEERALRRLV